MLSSDFRNLIKSRRTVRDFLPRPIPEDTLAAILKDASECASWSNTRPYCIAVATGDQLERLRESYVKAFNATLGVQHKDPVAILKAPFTGALPDGDFKTWKPYPDELLARSRKVGKALYTHMGVPRGDQEARDEAQRRNVEFFGAPAVLWMFVHKELLPFSALDAGIMLQTLMLSAKANGVDSCPLGVLATWRGPVDKEFEIPSDYKLVTGLALGFASGSPVNGFRAERPSISVVKSWAK